MFEIGAFGLCLNDSHLPPVVSKLSLRGLAQQGYQPLCHHESPGSQTGHPSASMKLCVAADRTDMDRGSGGRAVRFLNEPGDATTSWDISFNRIKLQMITCDAYPLLLAPTSPASDGG